MKDINEDFVRLGFTATMYGVMLGFGSRQCVFACFVVLENSCCVLPFSYVFKSRGFRFSEGGCAWDGVRGSGGGDVKSDTVVARRLPNKRNC